MKFSNFLRGLAMAGLSTTGAAMEPLRRVVYIDQYHNTSLPGHNITKGITHAIMAFANTSIFVTDPPSEKYVPFTDISKFRAMFDNGTKIGIALGGWNDTIGFSQGAKTDDSRKIYAKNVKAMADEHGFDFVDIDWEYPGGNGADYKETPNSAKTSEITTFPLFLQELKKTLGDKQLSIAVPGTKPDMIAYQGNQTKTIFDTVDMVNIMSYDLMMRRSNETKHHTSVIGSMEAVWNYIDVGAPADKINLGFAFYAKFFQTPENAKCTQPIGCPIVSAENENGVDAGTSGVVTFESLFTSPPPVPANLKMAGVGAMCGAATGLTCAGVQDGPCCSQDGWCGNTDAHCGAMCQRPYSTGCKGPDVEKSFQKAMVSGQLDDEEGGLWYWDEEQHLYWTWENEVLMQRKFREIVTPLRLGGVMAWSLGEASGAWNRVQNLTTLEAKGRHQPEFPAHVMARAGRRGMPGRSHSHRH